MHDHCRGLSPYPGAWFELPAAAGGGRVKVLRTIRELAEDGMTCMIVTHEMDFARDVSSRVVFMDNGRIVEQAAPQAFFARPETERARRFLQKLSGEAELAASF